MPADEKTPVPPTPPSSSGPATGAVSDTPAGDAEVAAFIEMMQAVRPATASGRHGRLIFAMDATLSRQPTWDMALQLQSGMFAEVQALGGLDVQLIYFRGLSECRASRWADAPETLARLMTGIKCEGGKTQIGKILSHAKRECERQKVDALVYVGDAMEEEPDDLTARAGELALMSVPAFLFQEGYDPHAATVFREIARLTNGAYCRFDAGSAKQLRDLLRAVAAYAAGGRAALEDFIRRSGQARLLLEQLK